MLEFYRKQPQALVEIRGPIFEQKVVDHIVSKAKVTDKPTTREELQTLVEEEASMVSFLTATMSLRTSNMITPTMIMSIITITTMIMTTATIITDMDTKAMIILMTTRQMRRPSSRAL